MNEYVVILKNGKEIRLIADTPQIRINQPLECYVFYLGGTIIARFNLNFIAAIIRGDQYEK